MIIVEQSRPVLKHSILPSAAAQLLLKKPAKAWLSAEATSHLCCSWKGIHVYTLTPSFMTETLKLKHKDVVKECHRIFPIRDMKELDLYLRTKLIAN